MRYSFHGGIAADTVTKYSFPKGDLPSPSFSRVTFNVGEGYSVRVSAGDLVLVGTVLADNECDMPVLSSVSGSVSDVSEGKITVTPDGKNSAASDLEPINTPLAQTEPETLCEAFRRCAVATPACPDGLYRKCTSLYEYEGKRRVIVDCTCAEPFHSTNKYIAERLTSELEGGIKILIRACKASGAVIICDDCYLSTVRALEGVADGKLIAVRVCEPNYPLSNEKLLVHATIGRECHPDKTVADYGCVTVDAEACVAAYRAALGVPFTSRLLSLSCYQTPNLISVPLGAPLSEIIDVFCLGTESFSFGAFAKTFARDGLNALSVDNTVKVLVADKKRKPKASYPCIGCMRCEKACPMYLSPYRLMRANGDEKKLFSLGAECCIECNVCSAVCPSGIDLPLTFRKEVSE